MKPGVAYPPDSAPLGIGFLILLFGSFNLLVQKSLADQLFSWAILAGGVYYLASSWWEGRIHEQTLTNGVDLEARILNLKPLLANRTITPIIAGVPHRALKIEYELNGETYVSQQNVPESLFDDLKGKETVRISVHPRRPKFWVPIG